MKMMNDKGGSVMLFSLMLCVTIIVLALAFAPGIKSAVDSAMTSMSCSTETDIYILGACIVVDLFNPYFIAILFGIAATVLGAKIISGENQIGEGTNG